MQDTYRADWRAKRMSAAQLIESHKTWGPMLSRWVAQAKQNAEYQRQLAEERKLSELVNKMEPVPNWYGPCIVSPKGEIFPVMGGHETTANQYFRKHLADEYAVAINTRGYIDALQTLCDRGWVRVSWYGEITNAYRSDSAELTDAQIEALTAMADEKDIRLKMGGQWLEFSEHLRRSINQCQGLVAAGW